MACRHWSDIGFVYAGMNPRDAADHLLRTIKQSADPVLKNGSDAVVSIILDGENAWEGYHQNGRDFLRFFYDGLGKDSGVQAVTVSEAIALHNPKQFGELKSLVPGSWINANFNVWIGAPEDNRAWDYLSEARDFYDEHSQSANPEQRRLALEELLIAEGSDWNWWYGPEHHSANDRDFDELYRAHLSNVYQALGAEVPDYLAQPIGSYGVRPNIIPQTAYITPRIDGRMSNYFDWMGAAMHAADNRTSAMHGKQFILDAVYAGVNETSLSARADFTQPLQAGKLEFRVHIDVEQKGHKNTFHLDAQVNDAQLQSWRVLEENGAERVRAQSDGLSAGVEVAIARIFELRIPFALLGAKDGDRLRVRFSAWRDRLPIDALPLEGSINLDVVPEEALVENSYAK